MRFAVYVPDTSAPKAAVYWLSGLTCTEENFMMKAGAFRAAARCGVVLVAPDTSPRQTGIKDEDQSWDLGSGAGFYVNATREPWSRHYRMYDYVLNELPELVETQFDVRSDARSVMGHSMGGHGALVMALRNPEVYRSVSAFAPICAPSLCPWGEQAFTAYLGEDRQEWKEYDAHLLLAQTQWNRPIMIDQGSNDSFLDLQLKPHLLLSAAEKRGVEIRYRLLEGYDHSYYFIQTFIDEHIEFHAGALARTSE